MTTFIMNGEIQFVAFQMKTHLKVMNELHLETMKQIKTIYMPFHFSLSAYKRYDVFVKRSRKWQKIKARVVHHQRPNEWTGALRQAVLLDSVTRSTATRGTFSAKAPKDSVIKWGPLAGKVIRRPLTEQRRLEMETVSRDEIGQQTQRMHDQYLALMFDPRFAPKVLKKFR